MSRLDALASDPQALAARYEPVDLAAIVADETARAGAGFTGNCDPLNGDARLLRRLVRNLLDNARRHAGAAPIEVTLEQRDAVVVLSVCDRGPGVAEAERERIFEPFYRAQGTSESAGGAGLGLALVRSIARQHGGTVVCLPRVGGGSVFEAALLRR
jgi:signal transduction histidine kinase